MLDRIYNTAKKLHLEGRFGEELAIWDKTTLAFPENPGAPLGMASSLMGMGHYAAAEFVARHLVAIAPDVPDAWYMLAQSLRKQQENKAARQCYDHALKLKCDGQLLVDIYTGYAGSYVNMGEPSEGLKWVDKALALKPDFGHALNAKALLLLETGNDEGWKLYAERWKLPGYSVRDFGSVPQWDGKTKVKTLAIHAEQGLGDEILFASCVPALREYAEHIVGECQGRLIELFRRSFPYVTWYATPPEMMAAGHTFDAWYRMGDLPGLFGPQPKTFLKADPVKVAGYRARLQALGPGPYVGFSWKGGSTDTHERVRNASKDRWRELISKCKGTAVSVQYGPGDKLDLPHWNCAIDDLDEFAALIAALDLVISCCGASVHFAGGLGVPCWAAVPKECAWRYAGEKMRWYDSVKMHKGSWDQVFYGLGYDLEKC